MDFNNWIRKLFFFFSMNPVYKFVDRSNFLFLQPPKLFHEYHQLDKKKKTKFLLFSRNSGLIMSEKFCIPVSIANFVCRASTKGSNNLEFKQSFERIGWRTRKEKTKGAGSMTHARLLKESPTTSSRSRHSLAPPSKPTCSGSHIRGPLSLSDFYMLPFLPPHESANLRILLSSHSTSLLEPSI